MTEFNMTPIDNPDSYYSALLPSSSGGFGVTRAEADAHAADKRAEERWRAADETLQAAVCREREATDVLVVATNRLLEAKRHAGMFRMLTPDPNLAVLEEEKAEALVRVTEAARQRALAEEALSLATSRRRETGSAYAEAVRWGDAARSGAVNR